MEHDIRMLRVHAAVERHGFSRPTFYRRIKDGLMVPGVQRHGSNTVAWPSHELDAIHNAETSGVSKEELRLLVKALIAKRSSMRPAIPPVAA